MENSGATAKGSRQRTASPEAAQLSLQHYARVIFHRKWLVISVFVLVSAATIIISSQMPDIFTSETVILVDPQKVPESYVRSTVTGDVRNRLGTLSQQILSATRLQKIIDTLNLYPEDKKTLTREEVITQMRHDISVSVVSDFGGSQDLQAFRIRYSGMQPRLVAQVANELASLFIEENLKAREQQATGTTEFLQNQLQESRKILEAQEAKLKDFKLSHIGEMPDQQAANLQILGQLQSQMQLESEALNRAEQQKNYIQSMMTSNAPVVDLDATEPRSVRREKPAQAATISAARAKLSELLSKYTEQHPDVRRLRWQIEDEEAKAKKANEAEVAGTAATEGAPAAETARTVAPPPVKYVNPVLQAQLSAVEGEIAKHREEVKRLSAAAGRYQAKLEAVPVREQQVTELVRDYEISKAHYKQLLEQQLSAETATQLEIRQKGERFTVLDQAQPAEKPSRPQRELINAAGSLAGLGLGLLLALVTEFLGMSITEPEQITVVSGLPVLEVIPIIRTHADRVVRKRRLLLSTVSAGVIALVSCAALLYHFRDRFL